MEKFKKLNKAEMKKISGGKAAWGIGCSALGMIDCNCPSGYSFCAVDIGVCLTICGSTTPPPPPPF